MQNVLILLLLISTCAAASELSQQSPTFAGLESTGMSQESLSHWALEPAEMVRLDELIPIETAFSDVDNLTPYEILGKYATSEVERAHYAKRYVEATVDHQKRSLEWSVAVASVLNSNNYRERLMRGGVEQYLASIGYSGQVEGGTASTDTKPTGPKRIHAFVTTDDCMRCSKAFSLALGLVQQGQYTGIDVVFVGMTSEDQVAATQWALQHDIKADMVNDKTVTLNFENNAWAKERGARHAPLLINSATGKPIES